MSSGSEEGEQIETDQLTTGGSKTPSNSARKIAAAAFVAIGAVVAVAGFVGFLMSIFAGGDAHTPAPTLPPTPPTPTAGPVPPYYVGKLQNYPGYTGHLEVHGDLSVNDESFGTQGVSWLLSGVDPECASGRNVSTPNSCGIHIHVGTDCNDESSIGGHFYGSTTDPWQTSHYSIYSDTSVEDPPFGAYEAGESITTRLNFPLTWGHAMVLHDYSGGRVSCGIITDVPPPKNLLLASHWVRYPGYAGSIVVKGFGRAKYEKPGTQQIGWDMTFQPTTDCADGPVDGVANSCGIHIHNGRDCTDVTMIRGHLWNMDLFTSDPWKPISYKTSVGNSGSIWAKGTAHVTTGIIFSELSGFVMVVHDSSGDRIACSTLV